MPSRRRRFSSTIRATRLLNSCGGFRAGGAGRVAQLLRLSSSKQGGEGRIQSRPLPQCHDAQGALDYCTLYWHFSYTCRSWPQVQGMK